MEKLPVAGSQLMIMLCMMRPMSRNGTRLTGRRVIVTGSARGLGASIARVFAAEAASVLVTDILDESGEAVAEAIRDDGGTAVYQRLDVTLEQDWSDALVRCEAEFGSVNVLVSNAFKFGGPLVDQMS